MPLDAQQLSRLNALLDEALDVDPARRSAWLAGLTGPDVELLPRLGELLDRSSADADQFMRRSAADRLPPAVCGPSEADHAGDRIGPYELVAELGRGGMSTVWRAKRHDQSLVREVALKLPRESWGPGLARRLAQERNILATLEHPLIARLYDAGQTADGRPWFAMEQVFGMPIDEHCARASLDVRAKLVLYLQVLDAVAYAHARLVVHRDLKPGNILVDDSGRVRLLDFGVAKVLDEEGVGAGEPITRLHGRPITLPYASPEQLRQDPVTVASDIYALGVVLFELLTGVMPYPGERKTRAQIEAAILDDERRLASRSVKSSACSRALQGDIDAILAKALHVDSAQRYSSVEAFAADLHRHLNGEPVQAQRASRAYRAAKFVRRHRWALAAASAVALATVGGLGVALWQAKAAQRQAQLAQTRLNQAEGLLRFTSAVLTNQVRADETITLRELLQRAEASMERTMADRPVEHALAAELLAQWQGSLGDIKQSIRLVTAAIERLGTEGDPAVLERLRCRLGVSLSLAGESQAALSALDAALRSPSGDASSRLTCELHHATVLRNLNRAEEAMRWAQAAHKTLARLPNPPPWRRASVQGELGFALVISGKPSQAMAHFDEALRLHMSDPDAPTATTVFMFNNRAIALLAAGQPARAAQELENAIAFGRERTPDHQAPAIVLVNLGNALRTAGRLDDAENAYRRAQIRAREVNYPVAEAGAAMGLAALMLDRHNTAAARPHLESAQAIHANMNLAPESPGGGNLRIAQARWWLVAGERERADSALADLVSGFGIGKPSTAAGLLSLRAEVARGRGDLDAAIRLLQEALARAREAQGDFASSASAATVLVAQGEVESLRGRPEQAMALARQALNDALAAAGPEHPAVARAHKLIEAKGAPPGAP